MESPVIIIDTHIHPISADRVRYPLRGGARAPGGVAGGRRPGEGGMVEKAMTAEEMLTAMERAGVERAVLVQSAGLYGFDNSYIADSAKAHAGRCVALCAIDVLAEDARKFSVYWVEQRAMRGIRLVAADELDNPRTFAVWEEARRLGVAVDIQMQPRHLPKLESVLVRFPDIPVLIDHAANVNRRSPDGTTPAEPPEDLLALAHYANLYLKITSQNIDGAIEAGVAPEAFLGPLASRFGAKRLMWGSDSPATADQPYEHRFAQAARRLPSWRLKTSNLSWAARPPHMAGAKGKRGLALNPAVCPTCVIHPAGSIRLGRQGLL